MNNEHTLGDILAAAMKGNNDMLNLTMSKEEAMIYAKALAAAGRKIEAINIVREMRWLPLEKLFNRDENSYKAAKEFVEDGFVLLYELKVGDRIFRNNGHPYLVRAVHGNDVWLYDCEDHIHATWNLMDIRATFKHVENRK